ncbi:MAG TPA: hypothetical protein PK990_05045 [Salinivirgaceae bacterium]|nr:hypothetical protein [Salinivirgaceae bacterium]
MLSTQNKALNINLTPHIYGTLSEIGGGQEVARHFFRAGGASGTIAKSISAYDKVYSDFLYRGKARRYVSKERLVQMLETEFNELVSLLSENRGENTCFFSFANTVETLNFKKDNEGHGWIGIQYQHAPGAECSRIVLHVKLKENHTNLQQNTLGILGINLIYATFFLNGYEEIIDSLMDNLSPDQLEIDMLSFEGCRFQEIDNRLVSLLLVKKGLTPASVFDRNGQIQQPGDLLYKKNVLLLRGSFRPPTYVHFDMLKTGFALMRKELNANKENSIILCEITLNNLLKSQDFNEKDYLDRVDLLNSMGQNVLISNFQQFHQVSQYICSTKINSLRLVLGANILQKVFDETYYKNLRGEILEAMGRLFSNKVKLYVYPFIQNNRLIQSQNLDFPSNLKHLYQYLIDQQLIIDIIGAKQSILTIRSEEALRLMREDNPEWKVMVPVFIQRKIEGQSLFKS